MEELDLILASTGELRLVMMGELDQQYIMAEGDTSP